ncbi:MAG: hypothetical protein AB1297_03160 [bacterium]
MQKQLKYIEFSFDEEERELTIKVGNNEIIVKKSYLGSLFRFLIRSFEIMSRKKKRKNIEGAIDLWEDYKNERDKI